MKTKIIVIAITVLVLVISMMLSNYFPDSSVFSGALLFVAFSYFANKIVKDKATNVIILFTMLFIVVSLIIASKLFNKDLNYYAFITLFFYILAVFVGGFLAKPKPMAAKLITTIVFLGTTWLLTGYIVAFTDQHLFYKTIDGYANYKPDSSELEIINGKNNVQSSLSDFNDKIVVLDFWNNYCGVCYTKFPKMQALRNKYKDNPEIAFFAINSFEKKEEIHEGQAIFNSLEYNFGTYFQSRDKSKRLKIDAYPTVLVLKNDKVIFRGSIEVLTALDFMYLK